MEKIGILLVYGNHGTTLHAMPISQIKRLNARYVWHEEIYKLSI